jgi:hypothetical protein
MFEPWSRWKDWSFSKLIRSDVRNRYVLVGVLVLIVLCVSPTLGMILIGMILGAWLRGKIRITSEDGVFRIELWQEEPTRATDG